MKAAHQYLSIPQILFEVFYVSKLLTILLYNSSTKSCRSTTVEWKRLYFL